MQKEVPIQATPLRTVKPPLEFALVEVVQEGGRATDGWQRATIRRRLRATTLPAEMAMDRRTRRMGTDGKRLSICSPFAQHIVRPKCKIRQGRHSQPGIASLG